MTKEPVKKYNIIDQITADHAKILALIENITVTFVMTAIVFIMLEKTGITHSFLIAGLLGGTIASFVFFLKKMYYNEAFSEAAIDKSVHFELVERAILTSDYSKAKRCEYRPNKRMFSRFYHCQSELITISDMKSHVKITGPFHKIKEIIEKLESPTL